MPSPGSASRRSSPKRNAASVLPDPVGAWMSVCAPEAMTGQPRSCAGVGASKARRNQSLVRLEKTVSASTRPAYWPERTRTSVRSGQVDGVLADDQRDRPACPRCCPVGYRLEVSLDAVCVTPDGHDPNEPARGRELHDVRVAAGGRGNGAGGPPARGPP